MCYGLENVEAAIIQAQFAVAENGAVWIAEELMGRRVFPFICQHLGVIVSADDIVLTMHEAYQRIGGAQYGYGVYLLPSV